MKKFLALIFSSALILGACGNDDTSNKDSDTKSENKTEKKSEDKKDNKSKEDKKSKEEKKTQENEDNKSTQEDNSTEEQDTQETATNEQAQSQQQTQQTDNNQQQYSDEYLANNPVSTDGDWTPEMIEENERLNEEMEANAKVAKENGYTGIPNGDVGGVPTPDKYYSNDQLDPDTGLPMEDADQHDVE
ncbi:hypothetical protein [Staphylococcus hominis]|uniref:Lipoprotein n=1 Tax=Staphylococcus hominis TaxID=1290 RepID=A0A974QPG1_STAHO|nr:hypothetical protein [Staphylococcus hominis]PTK32251.1 hypothetical protein BUZ51_00280 [Staphylococcus hominis]RIO59894.1 hypothetical protein BUZ49_00595 [Staphylococcus hominis]